MNTDFLWSALEEIYAHDYFSQQHGATKHTVHQNIEPLRCKFPGRLISHRGVKNWSH